MTAVEPHDGLCPCFIHDWLRVDESCQCNLIARVREDARAAALRDAVEAVAALRGENENVLPRQFRAQALAAIDTLREKP